MLRSTIERILPQIDPLCDKLGVEQNHRDAFFRATETGEVSVTVGEINWEGDYILEFTISGSLKSVHRQTWSDGDIYSSPVMEDNWMEDN